MNIIIDDDEEKITSEEITSIVNVEEKEQKINKLLQKIQTYEKTDKQKKLIEKIEKIWNERNTPYTLEYIKQKGNDIDKLKDLDPTQNSVKRLLKSIVLDIGNYQKKSNKKPMNGVDGVEEGNTKNNLSDTVVVEKTEDKNGEKEKDGDGEGMKGGDISSDNITTCFEALKNIFESTNMETISSFEVKTVDDIQKNYDSIDENNYNTINITKNENKEDVYDAYYFGIQHNKKTHVSDKVNISKIKDDKINLYETVIMTALWLLGNNKFANYIPQNLIWYILNKNSIDAKVAADAEKAVAAEKKAVEKADEKAVDAKKAAVEDAKNKIYQITFGNVTINAKIRDNFNFDDEFANNEDNLNGTGKVQTKDGIIINGTWKNGVVEYPYHETDIRGNRYEISISKSKRNGKAVTRVIRKQVYTASGTEIIKTNFIDSNGIMKTIGRYEGQYKVIWNPKTWKKEYVKEGEGKMEYSESLQSYDKHGIYNGKWKDNKRHGKGIMSYNLTTINEYDRYDKNTNEEKLKDLWWNYKSSKTNKPSLVKYFDGKWENDKPKEGKVKYYKTNKVEQYNAVKEKEDKDRREKAAADAKKARLKDLLKAMFIKNKAVVDVFQKYPTQTVESKNDKDTYDTAVIADNLVANALKAAKNAASATENAVEAAENAASATENAVEAAKNAASATENALKAAENALKAAENAVEAAKNVVNNRNTYNSIASAYVIALRKIEVVNKAVGAANDAFNAAKDAVVATNAIITGVDDGVS